MKPDLKALFFSCICNNPPLKMRLETTLLQLFLAHHLSYLLNILALFRSQNSEMTCLHAPHGEIGPSVSASDCKCLKCLTPSETALKIAVRSAQFVML